MNFYLLVAIFSIPLGLMAQNRSISITSGSTGEPLYHAYAVNLDTKANASSDISGRVRISARDGDSIQISYVGYRDTTFTALESTVQYRISLFPLEMDEVVIFAEEPFNRRAALGQQDVPMEFLTAVPSLTGDADIMKTITFLPGVSEGREGYSHLFVRGGAQDQNLILYDGATLFNVNHFGGFISMFHSEMMGSVDFYKSYWPSQYGGRLSSVMDIRSARGNFKKHKQSVDLGLIYSKIKATGPLWNDKISYSIGARRTFIDLFTGPIIRKFRREERGSVANIIIHDLNPRIDYRINNNQHISLSGIHSLDRFYYFQGDDSAESDDQYRIRNRALALNYSYYLNNSTTLKAHTSISDYLHFFNENRSIRNQVFQGLYPDVYRYEHFNRHTGNSIRSHKISLTGESITPSGLKLDYGADFEDLDYGIFLDRSESEELLETTTLLSTFEGRIDRDRVRTYSVFADAEYPLTHKWRLKAGLRIPYFQSGDFNKWMWEPKFLTSFDLSAKSTVNASYNLQQQHISLLGYTELEGYYREFYTTADGQIPTSLSHQLSVGYFRSFDRIIDNLSVELFYKDQKNVSKFIPSVDEDKAVLNYYDYIHTGGNNKSYGLEALIQKTSGNFHGSLAYTYSHSRSTFSTLNSGRPFNSDFDYRHNINILLLWKFGDGFKVSGQWTYKSGRPFTIPNSHIPADEFSPRGYPLISEINNYRMPAYHRLDLSLDREWFTKRKGKKQWFGISVYNAYNRVNPFFAAPNGQNLTVYGFFPIIPSFHFGFEP